MKSRIFNTAMAIVALLTPSLLAPSRACALSSVGPGFSRLTTILKQEPEQQAEADSDVLSLADQECYRTFLSLHELDLYYENQKDYPAEEKVLLSCMRILHNSPNLSHVFAGTVALKLSNVYVCLEKFPEARHYVTLAIAALTNTYGKLSADVAIAYNNLGWIDFYQHRPQDAVKHIRTAASIVEELYGRDSALYFWISSNLNEVKGSLKSPMPKAKVPHRL